MMLKRKHNDGKRPKVVIQVDGFKSKLEWPDYWPIPQPGNLISFDNMHNYLVQQIKHLRMDKIEEIIIFCTK